MIFALVRREASILAQRANATSWTPASLREFDALVAQSTPDICSVCGSAVLVHASTRETNAALGVTFLVCEACPVPGDTRAIEAEARRA